MCELLGAVGAGAGRLQARVHEKLMGLRLIYEHGLPRNFIVFTHSRFLFEMIYLKQFSIFTFCTSHTAPTLPRIAAVCPLTAHGSGFRFGEGERQQWKGSPAFVFILFDVCAVDNFQTLFRQIDLCAVNNGVGLIRHLTWQKWYKSIRSVLVWCIKAFNCVKGRIKSRTNIAYGLKTFLLHWTVSMTMNVSAW